MTADQKQKDHLSGAFFDAFNEPLALLDASGGVLAVNAAFARTFAAECDATAARATCASMLAATPLRALLDIASGRSDPSADALEVEIVSRDDRHFSVRPNPLPEGGSLLLHFKDVSEEVRLRHASSARDTADRGNGRSLGPPADRNGVRSSEARMVLALKAAGISIWEWDLVDDLLVWSEGQHELFGIAREAFTGSAAQALGVVLDVDRPKVDAAIRHAIETQGEFQAEFRVRMPDGEVRWLAGVGQLLSDETGAPMRLIGVNFDISDRKRAEDALARTNEELEHRISERTVALSEMARRREDASAARSRTQRLEAIGQLAGGVAHDFNNLLSVIGGSLELAEMRIGDPHARDLIHSALQAVENGSTLTARLLAFAQKRALEPVPMALNDRVSELMQLLGHALGENIEVKLDLDPDLWPVVADPGEIDCALLNLAMNGRDAMPKGGALMISSSNMTLGPRIQELDPDASPGDYVRLAVRDTGMGMSEDVAVRAFDPFFSTKEPGKGTGLGLSGVFGFAKQSGGFATIESAVGAGATVSLYLPRALAASSASGPLRSRRGPEGDGRLILVVEDDDAVRSTTVGRVRALGYAAAGAQNAHEAIERLLEDDRIKLVFSDIAMPGGMSGYELFQWIRRNHPDIKVLLTTGYEDGRYDDVAVLHKPYTLKQLAKSLRDTLKAPAVSV